MTVRILRGDVLAMLATLPDESVHCCVTSPPYYGLRDYGVAGQLGLEPTLAEYIEKMVAVFGEVRRVLRSDGTLWLNIGDSYARAPEKGGSGTPNGRNDSAAGYGFAQSAKIGSSDGFVARGNRPGTRASDAKPKDLLMVPERLALALQADGWWVRSRIIWHKLSAMPESVTDRPTKAHEHLWLLSKSERYFYDTEAAKEPVTQDERRPTFRGGAYVNNSTFDNSEGGKSTVTGNVRVKVPSGWDTKPGAHGTLHREGRTQEPEYTTVGVGHNERDRKAVPNVKRSGNKERKDQTAHAGRGVQSNLAALSNHHQEYATRNWRDVWSLGPEPFKDAHFATFPTEIPRRAIVAGCPVGGTVLDPFLGSGTTALVADRLQRNAIGIELNPAYADMAEKRIRGDAPLLAEVAA